MDSFQTTYLIIAMLTAGVGLSAGLVHLFLGLSGERDRLNLVFGIMGISIFIFLLWPPMGFIIGDQKTYPASIIVKRIFIWIYYILLPWFIAFYSGYKKTMLLILINLLTLGGFFLMAFDKNETFLFSWQNLTLVNFGSFLIYGMLATVKMKKDKSGDTWKWLFTAMFTYAMLYVILLIKMFAPNIVQAINGKSQYFSIHLNHIVFTLIMSVGLHKDALAKRRLEKVLQIRKARWDQLMTRINLMVITLDVEGKIIFANSFTGEKLGYKNGNELISLDWFSTCLKSDNIKNERAGYKLEMEGGILSNDFKNRIHTKDGDELVVHWNRVLEYGEDGAVIGSLNIGIDLTETENAYAQMQILKSELEKENILQNGNGKLYANGDDPEIIGNSQALSYAIQKSRQVAETNVSVLLEGETGVGKELFANLIHKHSTRKNKPLIKVNCAALPPELIESELFGHEKGAFTHALVTRKGRFELANSGTLFLDEIGDLPQSLQPKLLRVLQTGEFERIGGQQTIQVDVRIISATNRDLLSLVRSGFFREDLYYRLNVFPVTIPTLRNRKEDIPLLVDYFIKKLSDEFKKPIFQISRADMNRLCEYHWPGNIRELINVMERSMISSQGDTLKIDWDTRYENAPVLQREVAANIRDVEKAHILKVLKECNWKINGEDGAAEKLGLNPNTLRSRMKKLNIQRANGSSA